MKPTNATGKGTSCTTGGGTGSSATCHATGASVTTQAAAKADASKRYGDGTTAAQVANSNGAPAGTTVNGPGNSQPHKVAVCPHKTNRGGGVDVHAVKNFTTNCASSRQSSQSVSTTVFQTVVATQVAQASQASAPQGGVLGVTATESRPAGGVLGALATFGNVAGETLPFTGFPDLGRRCDRTRLDRPRPRAPASWPCDDLVRDRSFALPRDGPPGRPSPTGQIRAGESTVEKRP